MTFRDRTEAEIAAIVKILRERGIEQDDIEAIIGKVFAGDDDVVRR